MIKKKWQFLYTLFVITIDFLIINVSFLIALNLRFPDYSNPYNYWQPWLFINLTFFPLSLGLGIYRDIYRSSLENQRQHLKKFTYYLALFTMSYLFIIKGHQYSRGVVIIFLLVQYFLLEISHSLFSRLSRFLHKQGFGNRNALIVGTDLSANRFSENLMDTYGYYYNIKGFIANGEPTYDPMIEPYIIGKYEDVDDLIPQLAIDNVFVVSDKMHDKKYDKIRSACEKHHIQVKMVSPYLKNLMHQIKVKDVTGVPLTTSVKHNSRYGRIHTRMKRIFDLTIIALSSVFLLPVGLVFAALIKLTSKGPVFFKQKRSLYKGGSEFWFYKFRTMRVDADEMKDKIWDKNETNGALFKMKKDPRVTPVGRFLRKYSLDELPQLINVLKGEMSIVGPRPLPVKDFEKIKNGKMNYDWYTKRGETKPGITGLWQVSGRSKMSFEEMCFLDLYYIENESVFFDLEIIFETIPVIFFGKGAY